MVSCSPHCVPSLVDGLKRTLLDHGLLEKARPVPGAKEGLETLKKLGYRYGRLDFRLSRLLTTEE